MSNSKASPTNTATQSSTQKPQVVRETIESLAVAFILALMFKAFIAEAFVIPTGSMAPTLMGAHKDVVCDDCGYQYQCGASSEFSETGAKTGNVVFGTVCPLCRKPQILDLPGNSNHKTFSGDRILVSKLAYAFGQPQRWHVFVFKYLEDARLNYIKRCVGRPNESIRIQYGDIFVHKHTSDAEADKQGGVRNPAAFEIARKPPHVLQAMLQPLSDSNYVSKSLLKASVPDAWQPERKGDAPQWQVGIADNRWSARVTGVPDGSPSMLRYHHRVLDPLQWESLKTKGVLPKPIDADAYRLVTDFTAYNAHMTLGGRLDGIPANFKDIAPLEERRVLREGFMARGYTRPMENDGLHWTGDLSGEWEISTEPKTRSLRMLLVEAGVEHICDIDLSTGVATARLVYEGQPVVAFDASKGYAETIQATTSMRSGGKHRLQFANVDDSLTLWVDGKPVAWGEGGKFSVAKVIPNFTRTPRTSANNPLDAAPIAIGVNSGGCTITHAKVARDIYYIAHSTGDYLTDYNNVIGFLNESATKEITGNYIGQYHTLTEKQYSDSSTSEALDRNAMISNADAWAKSLLASQRRAVSFDMSSDHYFPMGDNSSASQDARSWREHHVPGRLLIGRAVMVFWPHYWNAPIPFLPNFKRMGLIR